MDKITIHVEAEKQPGGKTAISISINGRCTRNDMLTILLQIGQASQFDEKAWLDLAIAGAVGDTAIGGEIRESYTMGGSRRVED